MSDWRTRAACRNEDPELFFPVGESDAYAPVVAAAKSVCGACPVRVECLESALETNESAGIWGGLTPKERASLKRQRRRVAGRRDRPDTRAG